MTGLIILLCNICIAVCQEIIDHLEGPEEFGPQLAWKSDDG